MSSYGRVTFDVADTGTSGDTGPAIWGELLAVRWNPTDTGSVGDTGATGRLDILPREGDSGDGWTIFTKTAGLNADFVDAPRQAVSFATGADNSGDTGWTPHVFAGDRLRFKVLNPTGSTNQVTGRLYAYFRN